MNGVRGNRAALLRAGVPRGEADSLAGGGLYTDYLPVPESATPREITAMTHSPGTFGLDFFQMGKKKKTDDVYYEGFLLLLQPISYFLKVARIGKRSSLVSVIFIIFTNANC